LTVYLKTDIPIKVCHISQTKGSIINAPLQNLSLQMARFIFSVIALSMLLCTSVASAQVTINTDNTWRCFPLAKPSTAAPYGSTNSFGNPPISGGTAWTAVNYPDGTWTTPLSISTNTDPSNLMWVNTATQTWAACFRKTFNLTAANITGFHTLRIKADNFAEVWVNGNQLIGQTNWPTTYTFCIPSNWLNVGNNVIAVKAGEYINTATWVSVVATFGQTTMPTNVAPLTVTGGGTFCQGSAASTTLIATGVTAPTTSYSWSPRGQTTASINVPLTSVLPTTIYRAFVNDASGCKSGTATVTVNSAPTASIFGNTTICGGVPTTLTASGGGTYRWSTGATTAAVSVSTAGTYTVTVTGSNGCTATASATVIAGTQPFLDIIGNRFVCQGSASSLSAVPIVSGSVYTWKFNGQTITGTTLSIPATLAAGTYSVTQSVVNAQGCTRTNVFDVIVFPKPRINLTSLSVTCNGTNANVAINITTVGGKPAYTYKWSNGATTQNINVVNSSATAYSVTVTDANGCTDVRKFDYCMNPCTNNTATVPPNYSIGSTIVTPKPNLSEFKLESYPNPASNKVSINYSLPSESEFVEPALVIYDILGREMKTMPLKEQTGVLELNIDFPTGNYIYLIKDQFGEVLISKKIVISKN
jgi:Secretion system C-terminal sorting domain